MVKVVAWAIAPPRVRRRVVGFIVRCLWGVDGSGNEKIGWMEVCYELRFKNYITVTWN